ncbi:MAG TPA: TfoX/Sxy family protein [Alphaproteobacteria bacterium]|nr:TfoX/Sxy family protein [Alphaproteobacteria bacterium]
MAGLTAGPMQDGFVAHVLDLLGDWGGVSARRMFRSYGLYRQGAMFGLISRDTLYLRVDDRNRPDFTAAGSRPFRYMRGPKREVEIPGYMECPPDILEDAEEMVRWATAALAAARTAKAAKKKKRL